ncbi:GNAT family N-acetyltransferase [Sphingomonas mucosissima]|uniref:Putative N-acetyltransferase YafP n=1 Tax=Sphingomonas mucosissima TaxID=370959 RepID=A0A245ZJF4_9SPHN|nr:GNAT family N-acetyltransferase [Sphingomonas mucosissima]OWK29868.1 putative N-acetyltransferase YafP [Sphingomonas mucosissima]
MLIRPFHHDDAAALAALFHASVHGAGSRFYAPEQVAAWSPAPPPPERFVGQAEGRTFLVAVDEHAVVIGYGDLEPNGHIDHLYCRPDRIGTGVGSSILAALEAAARRDGIARLFVEASENARPLFERRGFTLDARNDFVRAGVAIHNYRMSKDLA